MRINQNLSIINGETKSTGFRSDMHKGQVIKGNIISVEGKNVEILIGKGTVIKAVADEGVNLISGTFESFQIVENKGNNIILKPLPQLSKEIYVKKNILIGTIIDIGLEPTEENIDFFIKNGMNLGDNLQKLYMYLQHDKRPDILGKLKDIFIAPEKIVEYLKNFGWGEAAELLKKLAELIKYIKASNLDQKIYGQILSDMMKGIEVQINNPFPCIYLPVPIMFQGELYTGDVWVEKDEKNNDGKSVITTYISVNTPVLGRVEAVISMLNDKIGISLNCNKRYIEVFKQNIKILEKRIHSTGLRLEYMNVWELKKETKFTDIIERYVRPFTPIDMKV